jgi:5'-3' exonuclease
MTTLLIDGDNLLTIGYYGLKNHFHKGIHIGGIFHFLNTIRRLFDLHRIDKVVVFWDGKDGSLSRKKMYHQYKENRKSRIKSEEEIVNYNYQRTRIKQYLEELFVRQGEFEYCECDDCIAYYVQNSSKEDKIIFSSDGDLAQLVSESTKLYNPSHGKLYSPGDKFIYNNIEIPIENIRTIKILCGDPSDNISGIRSLGINRLITNFPEITTRYIGVDEIIQKSTIILEENNANWVVKNLLSGVTKYGVFGEEFFEINTKIVSLDTPFLTDEARSDIASIIFDDLDPDGRSYKNTLKMMVEDGIFNLLPKSDDGWIKFLTPFLRLTRKEKNKRIIKIKEHE